MVTVDITCHVDEAFRSNLTDNIEHEGGEFLSIPFKNQLDSKMTIFDERFLFHFTEKSLLVRARWEV